MNLEKRLIESYDPPADYPELSAYGAVVYDSCCDEPVGWGFKIRRHLGGERFEKLRAYGELECLGVGIWVLVIKWLSPEEAINKYGPVSNQEFGPLGGWKSVTYGNKKFISNNVRPSKEHYEHNKDYNEVVLIKKVTGKNFIEDKLDEIFDRPNQRGNNKAKRK